MKERPILFSAPMVRAILAGTKTQTRRIMKPQPVCNGFGKPGEDTGFEIPCYEDSYPPSAMLWPDSSGGMLNGDAGHPWLGIDRLWVKETFHRDIEHNRTFYRADEGEDGTVPYLMDGAGGFGGGVGNAIIEKWTPSIFMSRGYSRLNLEILDVCAERLHKISEADARAEGITETDWYVAKFAEIASAGFGDTSALGRASYRELWKAINGPDSWEENPWVWVITFRRIDP